MRGSLPVKPKGYRHIVKSCLAGLSVELFQLVAALG